MKEPGTPDDRPLSDTDFRALARFRAGLREFLAFSEAAARREGLTAAQHQLLLAIRGHPDDALPSVTDLAEVLRRRSHSVVGLLDRAEADGLVETMADPNDGRRRLVRLSTRGHEVIARLSDLHRHELRSFRTTLDELIRTLD